MAQQEQNSTDIFAHEQTFWSKYEFGLLKDLLENKTNKIIYTNEHLLDRHYEILIR